MGKINKTVKTIKVDADKCTGCRSYEIVCSAFHAEPKWSSNNPARSCIQVVHQPVKDIYFPLFVGNYTPAECIGRDEYVIDGKEYEACSLCKVACPSRDFFNDPDLGPPPQCDFCEGEEKPLCVKWCINGVLIFEEREIEVDEEEEIRRGDV